MMQSEDQKEDETSLELQAQSAFIVQQEPDKKDGKEELWGTRHTFAIMGFLGFCLVYSLRVNLSVAIVAMVAKHNTTTNGNGTSEVDEMACPLPEDYSKGGQTTTGGDLDWNEKMQGLVLGAYYYGYLVTNLMGGMAAERWGGRIVFGVSMMISGVLTMLSPVAAWTADALFVAVRILEGMAAGVSFPAVNSMIAMWVLPEARSEYSSFIYAGLQFGTVITMALSGILCDTEFLGGWPSVFYLFGFLAILWSVAWLFLVRNTPAEHPRISQHELQMLKHVALTQTKRTEGVPWGRLLTSVPVWGTVIMHTGFTWGFYTLLSELPTYLAQIQHFSMSSNGLLSAVPYSAMYIFSIVYSQIVGRMTTAGKITIVSVRKLSMIIAGYGPMFALIGMTLVHCNRVFAVAVLCFAVGASGSMFAGFMCSHVDLAPRYAGTLMGFTNTFATTSGFVAPLVVGSLINENQTLEAWRNVFIISAAVYAVTTTVYLLTITSDVQEWNYYGTENYGKKTLPADKENSEEASRKDIDYQDIK